MQCTALIVQATRDAGDLVRQKLWLRLGVNIDDELVYAYMLTLSLTLTLNAPTADSNSFFPGST